MNVDVNQHVRNFITRGKQSLECKRPELAVIMFRQALDLAPKSIEARKNLRAAQIMKFKTEAPGVFSLKLGKLKNAFKAIKTAKLIKTGEGDKAMRLAEDLLDVNPLDSEYIGLAIKAAEIAGLPEAAAVTAEAACQAGSGDRTLLEKVAVYYTMAKNWDKAKEVYQKILESDPTDQHTRQLLKNVEARRTMASGWEQTAGKQGGTRDLLANPDQAAMLDKRNMANLAGDDVDKAAAEYVRRIESNSGDLAAARALARLYLKAKRFKDAVTVLEKAVSGSADPELDKMLSGARLALFDETISEFERRGEDAGAVKADRDQFMFDDLQNRVMRYPNDLRLRYELGSLYCRFEYYDEAIEHLQLAQKSPKDRLDALYLLAICFIKKGQTDLGVMQLETAASQIPTMTELKKKIIYQMGRCAEDAGNAEKAYGYYRDIYAVDIGFEDLNERMMALGKEIKLKEKKNA